MIQITDDRYDGFAEGFAEGYKFKEKKLEKYRWHDLRKNPEDLPDEDDYVLAVWEWRGKYDGTMNKEYVIDLYENDKKRWQSGINDFIAWKNIEGFEEADE